MRVQFTLRSMIGVVTAAAVCCGAVRSGVFGQVAMFGAYELIGILLLYTIPLALIAGLIVVVYNRWRWVPVLAILGLLAMIVVLLMPEVQQARDNARRTPCRNVMTVWVAMRNYNALTRSGLPAWDTALMDDPQPPFVDAATLELLRPQPR